MFRFSPYGRLRKCSEPFEVNGTSPRGRVVQVGESCTLRHVTISSLLLTLTLAVASHRHALSNETKKSDGSDLGITIMGAIVQRSIENNVALIKEVKSGAVKAVKTGHVIMDKFKVTEIHAKYITLINREGASFLVYQDKFAREFAGSRIAEEPTTPSRNLALDETYREEGFERVQGRVTMSAMYRDKIVKQDLAKVLMQATAEPHFENGQIIGFRFSQIDHDSIYAKGGLRDFDVVTSINGQKLNNVAGAISLLKSLKDADSLEIDIMRSGTPSRITINVNN
jgi:type II secretory pathway component PulC